jgi:ornithine--oxo-acid transaminase
MPLSAVVANRDVLGVITPGSHGSTFGGNPLACAVGREVVAMLRTGEFQERATRLGRQLATGLAPLVGTGAVATRVHGLWAGIDVVESGRTVCERLLDRGVLAKDAHAHTLRLAPPIVITEHDLDFAIEQLVDAVRQREHALS